VVYTAVGRRGIAESRIYRNSPFVVKLDTATVRFQPPGKRVDIKILSPEKYLITIEADDYEGEHSFGENFDRFGFDFYIVPRSSELSPFEPDGSNRYYFYVATPAALANRYRSRLSVEPIEEEATLVTLTVSGLVPEQEADYLNTLMDNTGNSGLTGRTRPRRTQSGSSTASLGSSPTRFAAPRMTWKTSASITGSWISPPREPRAAAPRTV
jgi:hypothetical protein